MKVLLLSRYSRQGASSRIRSYQYIPYLESRGLVVDSFPLFDDYYLNALYSGKRSFSSVRIMWLYFLRLKHMLNFGEYDLIWIEKEILPWLPAVFEKLLVHRRIPYLVDYDDAIHHRYDLHSKRLVRILLGNKIDSIMRGAATVTAGNKYLFRKALGTGASKVELLPSVVDLERYNPVKKGSGIFTVGWIGTPVTMKYLELVYPALIKLSKHIDYKLTLIGAGKVNLDGLKIEIIPWEESTEVANINKFDVGIMPLFDSPFERGKCGYKIVQYMACSLPVVASPVGANRDIVEKGVCGYFAESDDDWVNSLLYLYYNRELAVKMGDNGRKMVERQYSLQVTAPKLEALMRSCRV